MEVVIFLRLLWRRRLQLAVGAVVALAVGVALGGKQPALSSGLAATTVLVDTPRSALIDNSSNAMGSLYWRATLMAMLLGTDSARTQLAQETHVPVGEIAVIEPELTTPATPAVLPTAALQAASATPEPYVLRVLTNDVNPIITVQTSAPDRAGAARLAEAAVRVLHAGISPRSTAQVQGLTIAQIDPVTAKEVAVGGGHSTMALTAFAVFVLWCIGVAVVAVRGRWPKRHLAGRARATHA